MQDASSLATEILQGKGYVVLPELFMAKEISEARCHILNLAKEQPTGRFMRVGERSRFCFGKLQSEICSTLGKLCPASFANFPSTSQSQIDAVTRLRVSNGSF
jgi:hypothetical protein